MRVLAAVLVALAAGRVAAVATPWRQRVAQWEAGWHKCPGGQQTCADDATCCSAGEEGGYLCCQNITTIGGPCCGGGCCIEAETCCSDDKGYACCMQQSTYCVSKTPGSPRPARCCPRWTVGCESGTVGCCDPALPWQWTVTEAGEGNAHEAAPDRAPARFRRGASLFAGAGPSVREHGTVRAGAVPPEAYALVVSGWDTSASSMIAITIDTATGKSTNKVQVSAFPDNPAGESTREFLWDPKSKKFYYFDANFTAFGGARPSGGRQPFVISVDPTTGAVAQRDMTGAKDFPTGYALASASGGTAVVATEAWEKDARNGFHFYSVDLATAAATPIGTLRPDASKGESDPACYGGFHRSVDPEGKTAFRVGYKLVTAQVDSGVGATSLTETAATTWADETVQGHDYFMSADVTTVNGSATRWSFVSLAPSLADPKRSLDVVRWSPADKSAYAVVATLGDAHPPRAVGPGQLGYMATVATATGAYGALVVDRAVVSEGDRWELAVVDLATGGSRVMPLEPRDIAGTWSVSGLGM